MNIRTHGEAGTTMHTQTGVTAGVLLSANTLIGTEVVNRTDDKLGSIKDLMMDTSSGDIQYAVISAGGFLGIGDKLYAVPWEALSMDTQEKQFILDVDVERFKEAPGFDKDNWPDMADETWARSVRSQYGLGE